MGSWGLCAHLVPGLFARNLVGTGPPNSPWHVFVAFMRQGVPGVEFYGAGSFFRVLQVNEPRSVAA